MLDILYEDPDVLAINKPAGLVVIPGGDTAECTLRDLVAAYLAPHGERPYVVHRLDRGTSGVVLFARNAAAHRALNLAFDRRATAKTYLALVDGDLAGEGEIILPLHTARRGKMRPARRGERGLPSQTRWKALERFGQVTWLELQPLTGRQHQLRVHLKAIGHPLAFDPQYGRKTSLPFLDRMPLHAALIRFPHPRSGQLVSVVSPLPTDLEMLLRQLRQR